ncbi:mitochondrial amidoxime reducing component 2-like isoform X1 [Eurosta solidaginis]|uniref:mitochondrial amidoxime reducing component 2-like isoform X1 n=1 Tax=Eurosta solidaginis TaxID=178769 RepID=UPI0035316665
MLSDFTLCISIKMRSPTVIGWLGVSAGFLACSITAWVAYRKRHRKCRRSHKANEWQHLGTVKTINFYPLKGAAPIRLQQVDCSEYGFHTNGLWERCLVAYDKSDKLVYSGSYPRTLNIRVVILGQRVLRLESSNMPSPIRIDLNELLRDPSQIVEKLRNKVVTRLVECHVKHHDWLSRVVLQQDQGLRLYVNLKPLPHEAIDISPIMVMHERSAIDLNERLKEHSRPVDCQQFRGNLVIDSKAGVQPYDEDNWFWLKIGEETEHSIIMRYNSDCLRCILVNVNVDDCTRNVDFEPSKTLKTFRIRTNPKEPTMGAFYDIYKEGTIKTGAEIYVQYLQ